MTPQSEYNADLGLRMAVKDFEARVKRLAKGRVVLEVHKLDGRVILHRCSQSVMTEEEVRRVMEERPKGVTL